MSTAPDWMAGFNASSHVALLVMVSYLLYQIRRSERRVDALEEKIGYLRGRFNGLDKE